MDDHEEAVRRIVDAGFKTLAQDERDELAGVAGEFFEPVRSHWRDHAQGRIGDVFSHIPGGPQLRAKLKDKAVSCGTTSFLSLIAVGLAAGYLLSRSRAAPTSARSGSQDRVPPTRPEKGPPSGARVPVFAIFGGLWDEELAAGLVASRDRPISESLAVGLRRMTVVWRVGAPGVLDAFDPLFSPTPRPGDDEYDWLYVKLELPEMDDRLEKDAGEHARCAAVDGLGSAGAVVRMISSRVPNRMGAELDFWRFQ